MKHSITVYLTGDVLQPVQVQQTATGKTVARARIGVVEEKKDQQGQVQLHHAQWSVEGWNDLSRILGGVPVGHTIMVEGKLVNESYTGQDGQKKWTTKVQAYKVASAGPSQYQLPQQNTQHTQAQQTGAYQAPTTQPQQNYQTPPQQGYQQPPAQNNQTTRTPPTGWSPPQSTGFGAAPTTPPGYQQKTNTSNAAPPQFDSEEIPF